MPSNKIDSNFTGLRVAEEAEGYIGYLPGETHPDDGVLPGGTPTWKEMEPNSYSDFGGQITTVARTPITASRQRSKGVTTDLDASAGFQIDFTQDNIVDLLPGFFFAAWRKGATPVCTVAVTVDSATKFGGDAVSFADGIDTQFAVNDIVVSSGFTTDANNGAFIVTSVATPDEITVTNLTGGAPGLTAEVNNSNVKFRKAGRQFASADLSIDVSGAYPALVSAAYTMTNLGLVPGQWVYIGGDATANKFANANNNGFARVRAVSATAITFDKTQNTMTTDAGTGKTIQLFMPDMIKNENDPTLIVTKSYQMERSLSTAGYEYVKGAVPNTLAFNVATADKVNVDMAFVATDHEPRVSRKSGTFPTIATSPTAFNTSSDFSRIRTAEQGVSASPLFAFITDLTLNINNNVTPAKAVGTLGAFDVNVGDFVVEGNITAYFSDVDAVLAVRNNADVTVDFALAKDNAGWVFDIPLLTLGEGRLSVEKDAPITLPVSIAGAKDPTLLTTLIACYFNYLPDAAAA